MNSVDDVLVEKTSCDSKQVAMYPNRSVASSYWDALYMATFNISKYARWDFLMIAPSMITRGYL